METKFVRYKRGEISALDLADQLDLEAKNGWTVVSAENDGDDFVVEFEKA